MLRYFYLLCLVIYINECFCYDHISNRSLKSRRSRKHLRKFGSNSEDCNVKGAHIVKRRQDNEVNENELAQIDVASFIQKPDFYADEELLPQENSESQLVSNDDDYEILKNLEILNKKKDYLDDVDDIKLKNNHNSALFKKRYTISSKNPNLEDISSNSKSNEYEYNDFKSLFENEISADNSHHPLKKSAIQHLSNLKFPFFFRRKNNLSKVTNINTTKKMQFTVDVNDYKAYNIKNDWLPKDIKKRADKENSCVKCRSNKAESKNERRGLGKSIIHNSRQYYQRFRNDNKNKKVTNKPKKDNINMNKDSIKSEALNKQSTETKGEKKSITGRQKKAYHKQKEKGSKKKKKKKKMLNRKEDMNSNQI